MISIPYILIAAILIAIWTIYRLFTLKKLKEKNTKREISISIFFIYFLILINLTICKMSALSISFEHNSHINYIPLIETVRMFQHNILGAPNAIFNVIGNILAFLPLGFFIPLLFEKKNKIGVIALYGFLTSLLIETIQYFTAYNLTDIDDIIFNTLGAILGYVSFNIIYNIFKKTTLGGLVRNVTSNFDGRLIRLIFKPVSIMLVIISTLSVVVVYNSTMSDSLSDEEIAKEVFEYSSNSDFEALKDAFDYKLFLKDEGAYFNLLSVKRF